MYQSSSSSSSQGSMALNNTGGITRYDSAPSAILRSAVDSVIGSNRDFSAAFGTTTSTDGPVFSRPPYLTSETSESNCKPSSSNSNDRCSRTATNTDVNGHHHHHQHMRDAGFRRSFATNEVNIGEFASAGNLKSGVGSSSSLVRHSSSPAGFLNHLAATADNGFTISRGIGSYNSKMASDTGCGVSRLSSQLSFTRQDSLSHISEENEDIIDGTDANSGHMKAAHSYEGGGFGMGSWDDTNNSIMFSSSSPNKRAKQTESNIFQFSQQQATLEMGTMESLLNISEDSIPCKIRAKRGCATHPRSIAERERRTRISGRLKKLQELVPNMEKQTSYADMLDLAVEHIKVLQDQVEKLNMELEGCTCGCKQDT